MPVANNEAIYDAEIAPALLEIGKRCEQIGMPFLALTEWAPGEVSRTETVPDGGGCLSFAMLQMLARSAPNVDAFMISLTRYARTNGIDTSASMYMQRFGGGDA